MPDVTEILVAIDQGDPHAEAQLLPLVYEELRQLAAARLAQEKPGQTLQATALVHEAYLRLVVSERQDAAAASPAWHGRGHFFAAAAEAMRRILVDRARRKRRVRHGGRLRKHDLENHDLAIEAPLEVIDILALHEALEKFEAAAPRKAQLVKLRYFAGCTLPEAATMLGIAVSTAEADWTYAKAWLKREIEKS